MAEIIVSLTLDRARRTQFFAHLLVYLLRLPVNPLALRDKVKIEMTQEVAYRLFQVCKDEREEVVFALSPKEGQVIKDVLLTLKSLYEQAANTETSTFALEHLSACFVLLQEAEQHAAEAKERV